MCNLSLHLYLYIHSRMGLSLQGHGHSHGGPSVEAGGHGHAHGHQDAENINVRAAYIHVLGDIVQSVGVFIAALLIFFFPTWHLADPICTFLFSIIVLFTTFRILKDTVMVLMEATPTYLDYTDVMNTFLAMDGVVRVHNLRIWTLSVNKVALAAHLAIRSGACPETILKCATRTVHEKYKFFETTIQIEEFQPEMEDCNQCSNPV